MHSQLGADNLTLIIDSARAMNNLAVLCALSPLSGLESGFRTDRQAGLIIDEMAYQFYPF